MSTYTLDEKAQAVGLALVAGPQRAAAATGIPQSTIRGWRDSDDFTELRSRTHDEVAANFWAGIQIGLDQVVAGLQGTAPLRDKSIALGILYDKFALMSGGATSRHEARSETYSLTDHLSDADRRLLRDQIDRVIESRGGSDA